MTKQQSEMGFSEHTNEIPMPGGAAQERENLREELESERDSRLRLAAEYDNFRRRVRREQAEAADVGKRELLEQLISMADDLDLAIGNQDGVSEAVADVVRMNRRRLNGMLQASGVVVFDSLGHKFDPERHEAFDVVKGTETEPETVHTELRRGYLLGDKLLRPALVIVAQ